MITDHKSPLVTHEPRDFKTISELVKVLSDEVFWLQSEFNKETDKYRRDGLHMELILKRKKMSYLLSKGSFQPYTVGDG